MKKNPPQLMSFITIFPSFNIFFHAFLRKGKTLITAVIIVLFTLISAQNLLASSEAIVTYKRVNVRQAPSLEATIVTELLRDSGVIVTGEEGEWYKIETGDGRSGWLVQRSVRIVESVPEVEPEPEPLDLEINSQDIIASANAATGTEPVTKEGSKPPVEEEPQEDSATGNDSQAEEDALDAEWAEITSQSKKEPPATTLSVTSAIMNMVWALFMIIGLILILYYFIKKYFSKSFLSLEGSSAITVLASKYIGQKTTIHVVDVIEKVVILAISGAEIKVLTEIDDSAAIGRMRSEIEKLRESEKTFKNIFFDRIKPKPGESNAVSQDSYDILDELNEKIKNKVDDLEK